MKKTQNLIIALGTIISSYAQTTWYFGQNAGIEFPGGGATPTPTTSLLNSNENSSVMVDENKKVVMYTDGINIWNGAHAIQIANGLTGQPSSTQGSLIVPIPGTGGTKAFIFVLSSAEVSYDNGYRNSDIAYGLRVSLVNISGVAPNCVITLSTVNANKRLTPLDVLTGEKIAVTSDQKGGYWVLTHGIGAFTGKPGVTGTVGLNDIYYNNPNAFQPGQYSYYSYHITCGTTSINDLDATEVESSIMSAGMSAHQSWRHVKFGPGLNYGTAPYAVNSDQMQLNSQGQLKFSPDGSKVACTLPYYNNIQGLRGWMVDPKCQLMDFNLITGKVGDNYRKEEFLGFNHNDALDKDGAAAGVEFSPDGRYLYISSVAGSGNFMTWNDGITTSSITSRIYRYDLSLTTSPFALKQLIATVPAVTVANNTGFSQLQLGPDNKLYIARSNKNHIDVIADPNNTTLANVGYKTFPDPTCPVFNSPNKCGFGLPNKVLTSKKIYVPTLTVDSKFCQGSFITATGSYSGETPANTLWEITECDASGNVIIGGYSFGLWNPGVIASFSFPGSSTLPCNKYYRVKLAFRDECNANYVETSKIIYLACIPTPIINGPQFLCLGSSTSLCVNYPASPLNTILWNTGQTTQCITVSPVVNTIYNVTVKETARIGCSGAATFNLAVQTCTVNNRIGKSETNMEDEINNDIELLISPNPTNDFLTININDAYEKDIYLYDVLGKLVYKNERVIENDFKVDVSAFHTGIYHLKVICKGKIVIRKIIKQ